MKSAYELAMERLNKQSPTVKVTPEQKKKIAEIEAKYQAKIAEREIFVKGEIQRAIEREKFEEIEKLEKQMVSDRKSLTAEMEEKKEQVRSAGK